MSEYLDRTADTTSTVRDEAETPDILAAFHRAVSAPDGRAIRPKDRELIALAVGTTTRCVSRIDGHSQNAVKAGATEAELAEAAWVATAVRAGGGDAHRRPAFPFGGDARPHGH